MGSRLAVGTPQTQRFDALAERIEESLNFMKACGITSANAKPLAETELFLQVMRLFSSGMRKL